MILKYYVRENIMNTEVKRLNTSWCISGSDIMVGEHESQFLHSYWFSDVTRNELDCHRTYFYRTDVKLVMT